MSTVAASPVPAPDASARPRSRGRTTLVTTAWWAHGLVRGILALGLLSYGVSKLVFGQFGFADMGDALTTAGEMSPMGLLWRMVAYSPVFQFLAGLAEVGAAVALLWRRTVALGALLGLADMAFVFVLNIGYDVPVKQLSLALAVMSLVVLIPWIPRLSRALLGHGAIGRSPVPRLVPWRPLARVTDVAAPILAELLLVVAVVVGFSMMPMPHRDASAPAGVWAVQQDARPAAAQLAEDTRIQRIALGQWPHDGKALVEVRRANNSLQVGTYQRTGAHAIRLELRPQREPGQSGTQWRDIEPQTLDLTVEQRSDGTMRLVGGGEDLVVAPDASGRLLYDRGFSWQPRPDDPFNR